MKKLWQLPFHPLMILLNDKKSDHPRDDELKIKRLLFSLPTEL
jgi:hypothetical protein